jgi:hypothetical protein
MSLIPLALKRLTASDLTFFHWHFVNKNAGNQKAINLNADVFIDLLFPGLPKAAEKKDGRIAMDLKLFGPSASELYRLQRKIIKGATYKNWRLNGEFIYDPEGAPDRFQALQPGDLAVLAFESSDGVVPDGVTVVLLAAAAPEDAPIHGKLDGVLGSKRMMALQHSTVLSALESDGAEDGHPLYELVAHEDAVDAAQGVEEARKRLGRHRAAPMTEEQLKKSRALAEEIGRLGEAYVDGWLTSQKGSSIAGHIWDASANAISPFDFTILGIEEGDGYLADAKSTSGPHERPFHISMAELREAASSTIPYRILRVSNLGDRGAELRTSGPINEHAAAILESLGGLPEGVRVTSVTIDPTTIDFGAEVVRLEPPSAVEGVEIGEDPNG